MKYTLEDLYEAGQTYDSEEEKEQKCRRWNDECDPVIYGEESELIVWDKVDEVRPKKWMEIRDYFASSDLPNEFFFFYPRFPAAYWDMSFRERCECSSALIDEWRASGHPVKGNMWDCAYILIKRGLPRINDVKDLIMQMFQDANWPGFFEFRKFVLENPDAFVQEMKESLRKACKTKDDCWVYWLLKDYLRINRNATEEQKEALSYLQNFQKFARAKGVSSSYFKSPVCMEKLMLLCE
ncbi:MAG: DUF5071 domain-containing protein [Clostridia bacterium]|nr:DUF5071 domain-containing protein [Clostridia bacterium]